MHVSYASAHASSQLTGPFAARAPHDPIVTPYAELETLYGEDARDGVLPSEGPAFHVWRIDG